MKNSLIKKILLKRLKINSINKNTIQKYEDYITYSKGLSRNTIKAYISDLNDFKKFIANKDINDTNVNDYFKLLNSKKLSQKTKQRIMSSIMQYIDWNNNNLKNKIDIKRIDFKTGTYLPDTLSIEEINILLNSLDHFKFIESRNKTVIDFMYSTACRVSELCDVKISDLDFDDEYVKLTGKGNKQRIVPMGSALKENLVKYIKLREEFIKNGNSYLFLSKNKNKLERTSIYRVVKNEALKNKIRTNVHPHTLRHSAATHMLEGGCDLRTLQEFLGHSSVSTTKIYTKLTKEFLSEIFKESHPRA